MRKLTFDEIAAKRATPSSVLEVPRLPVTVLLESIRSLYNVGSIFRTSDAVQVEKLILSGFTPRPPRKEIEKTALGATKSVLWEHAHDPLEALRRLKQSGIRAYALELTERSIPYTAVPPSDFPICLVIGNEITGISQPVLDACDGAIELPMLGIKHSLNVAVAYGIAVFELSRIWRSAQAQSKESV
jgi:23S rRNA (guanosine2251-2'-O)-methyltransferase